MPDSKHFDVRLESLRGLAALAVVLAHASAVLLVDGHPTFWTVPLSEQTPAQLALTVMSTVFNPGAAVVLFFVLSGYVLTLSLSRGFSLTPYVTRRFFRLMPAMWASILLLAALLWLIPVPSENVGNWYRAAFNANPRVGAVIRNMALERFPVNGVTWTMYVEVIGSLFLPLSLVIRQRFGIIGSWIALAASAAIAYRYFPSLTLSYLVCFQSGAMLADLRNHALRGILPIALIAVVAFCLERLVVRGGVAGLLLNASAAVCLIAAITRGTGQRFLSSLPLRFLGRQSYSLYLVHPAVLLVLGWLAARVGLHGPGLWPPAILIGLAVVLSAALAQVSYRLVERPAIELGRLSARPMNA